MKQVLINKVVSEFYRGLTHEREPLGVDHASNVSSLVTPFARALGFSTAETTLLKVAAFLHDFGKISIPETLINKPAYLTPLERETMQKHTLIGFRLAQKFRLGDLILDVIAHHHENWDGNGYPHKLLGKQIKIPTMCVHILDVYDALISNRIYRRAFSLDESIDIMTKKSKGMFHPEMIRLFEAKVESWTQPQ